MASGNAAVKSTSSKKQPKKRTTGRGTAGASNARGGAASRQPSDSGMRNDIIGVLVAVVAIALFVAVVSPSEAFLARASANALFLAFGIGSYLVPIGLFLWSMTFFIHHESPGIGRFGLGIAIVIIAILSIVACFTEGAPEDPSLIFLTQTLRSHGGYLGGGVAWVLLRLVGKVIAVIILVGVAIVGAIVLGFSISGLVQRTQDAYRSAREHAMENRPARETGRWFPRRSHEDDSSGDATIAFDDDFTRRLGEDEQPTMQLDGPGMMDSMGEDLEDDEPTVMLRSKSRRRSEGKPGKKAESEDTVPFDEFVDDSTPTVVIPAATRKTRETITTPTAQSDFALPPRDLLKTTPASERRRKDRDSQADLREVAQQLQDALISFNLDVEVVNWTSGPTFTLFHIKMPPGVKVSRIMSLQDDIALTLAADSVRIFAPIPGTSYVGIEIPNRRRSTVLFGDVVGDIHGGPLEFAIGRNVEGTSITGDLGDMPHLLIGGTTGSGKSVVINSILMSILMRATPAEVRMILIDPKRVEFSPYNGIPHLYTPVVSDTKEVVSALTWATIEMERRFKVFQKVGTRKISTYNRLVQEGRIDDEDAEEMPYIVIVIDELSDLMMTSGKEVEAAIVRLAQLARAAGIHLVVATQRPASNVVTGAMKANITNRIALKVATGVDSRVIIDQAGAEKLIGHGDLLFLKGDGGEPARIQGCFVSDEETQAVVEHLKAQGEPEYNNDILKTVNVVSTGTAGDPTTSGDDIDPLLWDAAEIVVSSKMGSTSNIQRRLRVGYARAGRIMDQLEEHGIVGPPDGSRPREVLVSDLLELESLKAFEAYDEGNLDNGF